MQSEINPKLPPRTAINASKGKPPLAQLPQSHSQFRLIPMSEVEKRVSRSRWWIRDEINAGRFPQPVEIAGRRVVFVAQEIDQWIAGLIAKRDTYNIA